jgi:hypothetical protein
MKKTILPLLLSTAPLFAGEPTPMTMAPPPACDCPQGFTVGLEVLGLKPYQSEGDYNENDLELGLRGSLGYQFADCLFVELTGFAYEADIFSDPVETGELELGYVDLVVGQHFTQCEKLTLSPYVGLRWASFEESYDATGTSPDFSVDFEGLGIVVGIDATRSLGNNFSLYGTAKQSIVYGEADDTFGAVTISDDRVAFISEFGLGVQYDFALGSVASNVRAGVEGQWWSGMSDSDTEDVGLAGFVLGANFRF